MVVSFCHPLPSTHRVGWVISSCATTCVCSYNTDKTDRQFAKYIPDNFVFGTKPSHYGSMDNYESCYHSVYPLQHQSISPLRFHSALHFLFATLYSFLHVKPLTKVSPRYLTSVDTSIILLHRVGYLRPPYITVAHEGHLSINILFGVSRQIHKPLTCRHLISLPKLLVMKEIFWPGFETHPFHMVFVVHTDMKVWSHILPVVPVLNNVYYKNKYTVVQGLKSISSCTLCDNTYFLSPHLKLSLSQSPKWNTGNHKAWAPPPPSVFVCLNQKQYYMNITVMGKKWVDLLPIQ
jgi:hypothetical protein